jgi:hypothetical protein
MGKAVSFCREAELIPRTPPAYRAVVTFNRCACQRRWSSIKLEMKK